MKKAISILVIPSVLIAVLSLCPGSHDDRACAANPPVQMIGSIDNHYGISVSYTRQGANVAGNYSYTSVGKPLKLSGTIDDAGKIHLDETDAAGHKTGALDGTLINDERLTGTWSDTAKKKHLPFLACVNKSGVLGDGKDGVMITQSVRRLHFKSEDKEKSSPKVTSPVVAMNLLTNQQAAKTIQKSLLTKEAYEGLDDLAGWLTDVDYTVNYNRDCLIDCDVVSSGSSSYPSANTTHILVDTRTGKLVTAQAAFKAESLAPLKVMIKKCIDKEGAQALKENKDEAIKELLDDGKSGDPLAVFAVNDAGITFRHDWQFPHVDLAAQPTGEYLFSLTQMRPFIKPDGPLGNLLH